MVTEHYLRFYKSEHGLDYTALRYGNVYGPRQDPNGEAGVIAIFIGKFLAGEGVRIDSDGEQSRDYVYVGDVVRANVAALSARLGRDLRDRHRQEDDGQPRSTGRSSTASGFEAADHAGAAPRRATRARSTSIRRKRRANSAGRRKSTSKTGMRETFDYFRERSAGARPRRSRTRRRN